MREQPVRKNPRDASMTAKQDDNTPKSLELSEGQLEVHFRRLNLAHMRRIYQEVAIRAEKESWSYRDFLALLLAEEVARRKQTRLQRCTRSAHFPFFKTIEEFDFSLQSTLRESVIGSYLGLDFVTEGRSLILHGKTGRGKTHLAVAIGYRAIQNSFETLFATAAELIEDLSNASKKGHLQESLETYTHPHVLVIDEVGYLTYGPDAANVLFHVVNNRHLRKRPMIFTTNKPLNEWGKVLHDEDMAAAILDRVLERGRFIHLDGPSGRTRHLNLEDTLLPQTEQVRISGISGSEFPEPTRPRALFCLRGRFRGPGTASGALRREETERRRQGGWGRPHRASGEGAPKECFSRWTRQVQASNFPAPYFYGCFIGQLRAGVVRTCLWTMRRGFDAVVATLPSSGQAGGASAAVGPRFAPGMTSNCRSNRYRND